MRDIQQLFDYTFVSYKLFDFSLWSIQSYPSFQSFSNTLFLARLF